MQYFILYKNPNKEKLTHELEEQHETYVSHLQQQNMLKTCGKCTNGKEAVLLLEADDCLSVDNIINADPFIAEAYFQGYEVKEFSPRNTATAPAPESPKEAAQDDTHEDIS